MSTGDWTDDEALISQLTFPFSKHEPTLDDAELQRLDALADSLEIQGLTKMVLTDRNNNAIRCQTAFYQVC
jgi:hypothetical protein